MCDLCNYGEYSFEEIVLSEQNTYFKVILHGFGLDDDNDTYEYIDRKLKFEGINILDLNNLMNQQLKYFLEKGLLKNWEEYFAHSIKNRLDDGKEIDIEFFRLTYQILNMTIQENTCYSFEQEYVI